MKNLIYKYHETKALNFYISGDFSSAEKIFRKIKITHPDKAGIDHNIALCLIAENRLKEAEKHLLNEIENYGNCFYRNRTLGDLYYISGKNQEAKQQYELSLKDIPDNEKNKYILKRIQNCGDSSFHAKAVDSYKFFIEGNAFMKNNKYSEAHASFKKAADLDNTAFLALNNLGVIELHFFKNTSKAMEYFEKAGELVDLASINKNKAIAQNTT